MISYYGIRARQALITNKHKRTEEDLRNHGRRILIRMREEELLIVWPIHER